MTSVDYTYYTKSFGGGLSEAAFLDCLPQARGHVDWMIGYKSPCGACEINRYRRAVCAAVEAFANFGEGAIGISLGHFKSSVREGVSFSAEDRATEMALKELGSTGLAFCGVGR